MKMTFVRACKVAIAAFVGCIIVWSLGNQPVGALSESTCSKSGVRSYSGDVEVPVDVYDIYVKLGVVGQSASVEMHSKSTSSSSGCNLIGTVEASGDVWKKIGDYKEDGSGAVFELASGVLNDTPGVNRPAVMLVSRTNPACTPEKECVTTVAGQSAFIRPKNASRGSSLEIMHAQNLPTTEIKEVKYYADNELLYRTDGLEEFNLRAFPYYGSMMVRVVEYNSGQLAIISQDVPIDREIDSVWLLLAPMYKYKNILTIVVAIIGSLLVYLILKLSVTAYLSRRQRLIHHGFIVIKSDTSFSYRHRIISSIAYKIGRVAARLMPFVFGGVAVIILGVGVSSYIVQLSTIEGSSMEMSFRSGQVVAVDKLPVTLARLNQNYYIPERGQVIVAYPNFGYNVDMIATEETIIKRVIGLPGERVVVKQGKFTIFNEDNPKGFDPEFGSRWSEDILDGGTSLNLDVRLNEEQLFIVGDNRESSTDSRFSGPISSSQVVGRVWD